MKRPRGSLLLLALVGLGYALELWRGAPTHPAALLALGALPDSGLPWREGWRLLTHAFLHWNLAHVLANATLLAWLAPVLERRVGATRLLAIFFGAALAGGLTIVAKHALHPAPGVSVGASGGAFAVLAAATRLLWRDPTAPRRARIAVALVAVAGAAVSLMPGVSLLGHAVGAACGWLGVPAPRLPAVAAHDLAGVDAAR